MSLRKDRWSVLILATGGLLALVMLLLATPPTRSDDLWHAEATGSLDQDVTLSNGWSVSPDVLTSTQYVNQVVAETLTISNGTGVPLAFELTEQDTVPIQQGMVAYYPFNGNANDESGNGNHGTVEGATLTTDRFGNPSSAYSFDGVDDYVSFGTDDSLKVEANPFTLGMWIKPSADMHNKMIMASSQSDWYGYFLALNRDGGGLDLAKAGIVDQPVAYTFAPDTWYHIAAVQRFDGGAPSHVKYFVDGAWIGTYDDSSSYNPSAGKETRLASPYADMGPFSGLIDEVLIYDRALSEAEIQEIYNRQAGGDVPWLSQAPISGTMPADSSMPIEVTFDAGGLQPDTYTTQIVVQSNDPITPQVSVPVSMTVEPTASMGWVEGIISDAETGEPLEVRIIASGQPYAITSDPDSGGYTFWLDEGSHTLQATSERYITEMVEVEIVAQQGTIQDIELVPNPLVLWYVAPDGDNGSDCLSPASACSSINGALAKPGFVISDTVLVATGIYTGTGDEVVLLDKDVTLSGGWDETFTTQSGTSTIDGQGSRQGISVSGVTAVVERFSVENGVGQGGGIVNGGTLTLNNCTVSGNTENGGGGGIWNGGTLTLNDSTVSGNTATEGGGIYNGDILTLNNSTVSGNTGGGIFNRGTLILNQGTISGNTAHLDEGPFTQTTGGGIFNRGGTVLLIHGTISGNTARSGGGIDNADYAGGTVTLQNTIVAGNTASGDGPDCSHIIGSSGYNLIGDTSGCTFSPGAGDLTDVSANLRPLIGSPGYHPLQSDSPAIDAVPLDQCALATDQRGVARPQGPACDMGAYEYTAPGPAASVDAFGGTPQRTPPLLAFDTPLQALVLDSIGNPVDNVTVTFSAPASGASGTFADSGTFTATAVTDGGGVATVATFTANELTGSYVVTATVSGVLTPADFLLTNIGWYVSPSGKDSDNCQMPTTPCATVNGALAKAGFLAGDTVLVATGTYAGTGDEVVLLNKSVRLVGGWNETFTAHSGTSTIDGEGARRGIAVNGGVTAIVERFTVQNGLAEEWASGGGISNSGTLTLNHCIVTGNRTTAGRGGGIGNGGTLILNSSTVSGNTGETGGGIDNTYGTLTLNNSTVSGNTARTGNGGGIYNYATVTLNSSTISRNTASVGGGIGSDSGTVTLHNTILAGNTTSWIGPDCTGAISSTGYNLVGDTADCTFAPTVGDLVDVNPRLFPLLGLPGYHQLLPGSPAIDAGNPAGCTDHLANPLTADQRGTLRPLDGDGDGSAICDMGSYEFDPANNPITTVYLPGIVRNYCSCPDFFDDFGNPASGWDVVDNAAVRTQYLNGEYRILAKQSDFNRFLAPTCDRQDYVVEVDVRRITTEGSTFGGLIFGATSDFSRFYSFGVDPTDRRAEFTRCDPGAGCSTEWPFSDAINLGTASNHLKATLYGDQITLEVNGTVLGTWTVDSSRGCTGAGLMTSGEWGTTTIDARFDNFAVTSLVDSGG